MVRITASTALALLAAAFRLDSQPAFIPPTTNAPEIVNVPGARTNSTVASYPVSADASGNLLWPPALIGSGSGLTNLNGTNFQTRTIPATALATGVLFDANGVNPQIGQGANAQAAGTAIGMAADASYSGAAVGFEALASNGGAAIGRHTDGRWTGTALGQNSRGTNYGTAVGPYAIGSDTGVGIGYMANGSESGTAVGTGAQAVGLGNVAIGGGAYVPNGWTNTVEIGMGTATVQGGVNLFGRGVMDSNGVLIANGAGLSNVIAAGLTMPTNIAPVNTTTPKAWANFTNASGGVFKLPLYQ